MARGKADGPIHLEISLARQRLELRQGDRLIREYTVSTAKKGAGEQVDSLCTPRGRHEIAEMIGRGSGPNTVFMSRQPSGEIFRPELRANHPDRDWILTRILWLRGTEPGVNAGGQVDTYQRYIYIHGAPDDVRMGEPGSAGCIRMRNADVIELFDRVAVGTPVIIRE
ncbi:MAG: L,D-transpeptidase [Gammaproteobacteria bacterium]|nr:L,D-transpeptidase [Gammaproteobacteria bacterium]